MSIRSPEPDVVGCLIEAGGLNEFVARSLGETIQPTGVHGRQSPNSGYSLRHPGLNCAPTRSLWREPNTLAAERLPAAVPDSKPYSDDASVEAAALPRRDLLVQAQSERQSGAEESRNHEPEFRELFFANILAKYIFISLNRNWKLVHMAQGCVTMSIELPERDIEGYLIEPSDWNEDVARSLAQDENIQLTDVHWDAINFMRDYYEDHRVAADARFVIKHLAEHFGRDAQKKLFELFPYGYVRQACKIAGMRRPRAWSTG